MRNNKLITEENFIRIFNNDRKFLDMKFFFFLNAKQLEEEKIKKLKNILIKTNQKSKIKWHQQHLKLKKKNVNILIQKMY